MQVTKKLYDLQSLNFLRHSKLKIGVLGGSFNPAHKGHVDISICALKKFKMDYVIWLVANQNPLKDNYDKNIISRGNTALDLMPDNSRILVSIAERDLGTIYAYDSMKQLIMRFPNNDFTWLMGMDNILHFHKWYRYKKFVELCKIIIFDRPMESKGIKYCRFMSEFKAIVANSQSSNIIVHKGKLNSTSSTVIRNCKPNQISI